jgi:hypothetical protein
VDGKTLLRLGQELNVQVWDLQTGQRSGVRETLLAPLSLAIGSTGPEGMRLGVFGIDARRFLSHTKSPAEQELRYYLYDLDAHTHTYRYAANLGTFQNDPLGRAWVTSRAGGRETWIAPSLPGGGGTFNQTVAFGPGTTVRVEVNVGNSKNSEQTAQKMAGSLAAMGFKIGGGGWVLRADHTTGDTSTDITDTLGQRVRVATLRINWRLLDPQGNETWKGTSGGKFDPFNSKYVVVGSRQTDMALGGMGGGSTQVRLNYQGKDPMTAQVEEILEKSWYPGVPNCLVKTGAGYVALPLEATEVAQQP